MSKHFEQSANLVPIRCLRFLFAHHCRVYDILASLELSKFVADERVLMLDAFALLGGNENLVRQMLHRLMDTDYRYVDGL